MTKRRKPQSSLRKRAHLQADYSRRNFLKSAGVAAAGVLIRDRSWAQAKLLGPASQDFVLSKINPKFMITPDQAWEWASFKSQGGPTYAGGTGWKRYTDFLVSKAQEVKVESKAR